MQHNKNKEVTSLLNILRQGCTILTKHLAPWKKQYIYGVKSNNEMGVIRCEDVKLQHSQFSEQLLPITLQSKLYKEGHVSRRCQIPCVRNTECSSWSYIQV